MISCRACSMTFTRKWNLMRHVARRHQSRAGGEHLPGVGGLGDRQRSLTTIANRPMSNNAQQIGAGENYQVKRKSEYIGSSEYPVGEGYCYDIASMRREGSSVDGDNYQVKKMKQSDGDYQESDSSEEMDNSNGDAMQQQKADSSSDVFDQDGEETDDNRNSSTDDSDDCESSSEEASEGAASDLEGDVTSPEDCDEGCNEDVEVTKEYTNLARWRGNGSGLYCGWISIYKKPLVVQHREWVNALKMSTLKFQRPLIRKGSKSQCAVFQEVTANLLSGIVPLSSAAYRGFDRKLKFLRILASRDVKCSEIRRVLMRRSGLLAFLLENAIPTCIKSRKAVFYVE